MKQPEPNHMKQAMRSALSLKDPLKRRIQLLRVALELYRYNEVVSPDIAREALELDDLLEQDMNINQKGQDHD